MMPFDFHLHNSMDLHAADSNGDGQLDYALFNSATGRTLIGYL